MTCNCKTIENGDITQFLRKTRLPDQNEKNNKTNKSTRALFCLPSFVNTEAWITAYHDLAESQLSTYSIIFRESNTDHIVFDAKTNR